MSWNAFINWVSSWFVHDDVELKQILAGQAELRGLLQQLLNQEGKDMATLADLKAAVEAQTTVDSSVVTLLQGLSSQLAAAIAANDPAAIQAVLDGINANTKTLSDAVAANTPAAPKA